MRGALAAVAVVVVALESSRFKRPFIFTRDKSVQERRKKRKHRFYFPPPEQSESEWERLRVKRKNENVFLLHLLIGKK